MMSGNRILLSLLLSILLAGCFGETDDLDAYIQGVKARPPQPVEPLPEIQPIETFVFEPGDRRAPFTPDVKTESVQVVMQPSGPTPDLTRPKEELENFALDSLHMVGTLEQQDTRWGLIRDKEGTLHRVKVGNYMGMNNGLIVRIEDNLIELTEIVPDAPGQWRERTAKLALTE